ncbi:serine/threonine-protein kinase [Nonomuraea diastatica]|uniref:non-specific serine/threonine protein kinase n=1 Tax=Nonomuraea diastatica TaxID=1848329 RepID=A0A4R4X2C6_9ACTN|nr:serine/threonine-protein kinase [Nonomuraea diastatica]TDD24374.1 serine/threonine protein kinase [Nonomuraea diastatica]
MQWSAPGYTEIKQLGRGASGRVTLAVHDETGVEVAIKYLSSRLLHDPAALARFQSEARLLITLRDPHIATLWEYIQDPHGAAIVMELVNGVSLRALMREHGTTGPEAALVVLKGSLLGLAKAHALGLVHRDYKPENVIVRDDGVSKLVDFGIAVRQGTVARLEGTPPYMAPELWEALPASPATDVYAATAVFFECLTGHRPYRSTEPSVLGYQHLYAPVPAHDVAEPVRGLIRRGLAKDPALRPASASAFVAEVEATARAAYGDDWEERGRRRLAALVALLALLLPRPETPAPEAGTSLARTVFRETGSAASRVRMFRGMPSQAARARVLRGMRSKAARVVVTAGVAAAAAVTATVVLVDRQPPPAQVGAAAAVPPTELSTGLPTAPEATPATTPGTPAESTPGTPPEGTPGPASQGTPPSSADANTPEESVAPPRATTSPTRTPRATTPVRTPGATTTPVRSPGTPVRTPAPSGSTPGGPTGPAPTGTPTPTSSPATSVLRVVVGVLTVDEKGVARGTVTLRTSGTAPVVAVATWRAPGTDGRVQRVRLSGATSYTRTLTWAMGERPCGGTLRLAVTTSPAAAGGAGSGAFSLPPCPTEVTGLRLSLGLPAAPGRTATARLRVSASGTAEIPVRAGFAVDGEQVATRSANLSGRTSYTRSLTHTFRSRPCGATVSVTVRAGGRTATARTQVSCPPAVRRVSILRAAASGGGLATTVAVTTSDTQRVRLAVSFAAGGERLGTRTVTLSGDTSYTRTLRFPVKLGCGSKWTVTAATGPAAGDGGSSVSGSTPECPKEEPEDEPSQSSSAESPGTLR